VSVRERKERGIDRDSELKRHKESLIQSRKESEKKMKIREKGIDTKSEREREKESLIQSTRETRRWG
jgi:hypothetical protein